MSPPKCASPASLIRTSSDQHALFPSGGLHDARRSQPSRLSPTYYFRVRQAMELLEMYRQSPAEYARMASAYQGRPNWQSTFITHTDTAVAAGSQRRRAAAGDGRSVRAAAGIASEFGVRAGASDRSSMAAERSTIGSAFFIAHQLRRLQGERIYGFDIDGLLTHEGEEKKASGCTASDGRSMSRPAISRKPISGISNSS